MPPFSTATIIECGGTLADNHRGFLFSGGAISTIIVQGFTVTHGLISATTNAHGGAVYIDDSSPALRDCIFKDNSVVATNGVASGSAVLVNAGANPITPSFTNCVFQNNATSATTEADGAIFIQSANPTVDLTNCTFSGNYLTGATTKYDSALGIIEQAKVNVLNCIFYDDVSGTQEIFNDGQLSLTYSDVQGGFAGTGNINADPLFVSANNLQLQRNSPAVNTGSNSGAPADDLRGVARPQAGIVDMGAYEFQFDESLVVTTLTDEDNSTSDPTIGSGTSLREAINYANQHAGDDIITFNLSGSGAKTINLIGALPDLNTNIDIQGLGANVLTVRRDTGGDYRVFTVQNATVGISGLTISNGDVDGGGIISFGGTLTLRACHIKDNAGGAGSGFYNGGSATVDSCTFSGNSATVEAGGILNGGALLLKNSTFSANSAAQYGGALVTALGAATIESCTFSGNSGNNGAVAIQGGTLSLSNNIFNVASPGTNLETYDGATINSQGYNLSNDDGSGYLTATGDQINTNPKLGALMLRSPGTTPTFSLSLDSPALNAGSTDLPTDQRGIARPQGTRDDIGAYEVNSLVGSLVVTTLADEDNGTSDVRLGSGTSLREAIGYANQKAGADTITFNLGSGSKVINLTGALPDLASDITIQGTGANVLRVRRDTGGNYRIFTVQSATVSISGLTIANGNVENNGGGGILNQHGNLTLAACALSGNRATGNGNSVGGAIYNNAGIYSAATLTIVSCTISGNRAVGGGAIYSNGITKGAAHVTATNSTFSVNLASDAGGVLYIIGDYENVTADFENCTFYGNSANIGGSIYNGGANPGFSTVTLGNTIFKAGSGANFANYGTFVSKGHNLSSDDGSGLLMESSDIINTDPILGPLQINAPGTTPTHALSLSSPAINAGDTDETTDQRGVARPQGTRDDIGAYEFNALAETLVVTTLADEDNGTSDGRFGLGTSLREAINYANQHAGVDTITFDLPGNPTTPKTITLTSALPDLATDITIQGLGANLLTVQRAAESDDYPIFEVYNKNGSPTVNISDLTLALSDSSRTGIDNILGGLTVSNCTVRGSSNLYGGALYNSYGTITVTGCTVSGNSAQFSGGAVYNSAGTLIVTNSTFSDNAANAGGAIYNTHNGTVTVTNSTFSGNSANIGGSILTSSGTVQVSNTLFKAGATGANLSGNITSQGYNLSSDDGGGFLTASGDQINKDPKLGPLADNGGPTPTHALLPGSPAIEAGDPAFDTTDLPYDQRGPGFARKIGPRIDIGAFEVQDLAPTDIALSNRSVAEKAGPGALVGVLSGTDADTGDTLIFSLPAGRASNSLFSIAGSTLRVKGSFNYEVKNSYVVLLRATDAAGFAFDKSFTISVTDTNDAPVLNSSGDTRLSVRAAGVSIAGLLATGAGGAPISDEDAGAKQGVAVYFADSTHGAWQYSLNGGTTWLALGSVRANSARLLASDGAKTRLRFLAATGTPTELPDALKFFAWDQTSGANGALADASPSLRGGKKAFSAAFESVKVQAPGSAAPQLTITSPTDGTQSVAPIQATGTTSSPTGIVLVRLLSLYRTSFGGNTPGYWNGNIANPQFVATNVVSALPPVHTSDGFANWSAPLPQSGGVSRLLPGQYRLRVEATDAYSQVVTQTVTFTIAGGQGQANLNAQADETTVEAAANASSSSITLNFSGAIPSGDFVMTINGAAVPVQSIERNGDTLTLLLPEGTLKTGNQISVSWNGGAAIAVAE